ncbi:NADPH:quinone oxidoreductase family protein [Curtobacterium ammoniigenes]|uniref:NADPH:quinone oxidoreductase family protein n=1 Tax=Curtobacterium ammoniigenes TaxID=395387 RepID=UPI0009F9F11E|nr:NADPH:quinone oxidoreductase family protein [Curtobacterium ammoniigenes]
MQAVVIPGLDGPRVATIRDVPAPSLPHHRSGGVRLVIRVHAVGLSVIDILQSRGEYQYGTEPPYVLGSEVAGVVVEADAGSGFSVGDRVGSIVFWGGLAEYAAVAPDYTLRLPDRMSFVEGAALYLNASTAWFAYWRAGWRPESGPGADSAPGRVGGTVLVHGAAGGVGTAALGLAHEFGVRAIGLVSTETKAAAALQAGASHAVVADANWRDRVRELTGGHGVDAVLDTVGGDRMTDSLRALRTGGILVVIGFVGGAIPSIRVNRLLLRNLSVTGISMDTYDHEFPGTLRMVRDAVEALAASGRIRPLIDRVFPFTEAAAALRRIETRSAVGKVVVTGPGFEELAAASARTIGAAPSTEPGLDAASGSSRADA